MDTPILDLSNDTSILSSDEKIKEAVQNEISNGNYPMAIKEDNENYFGVLYTFEEENEKVKITPSSSWAPLSTNSREPAFLIDETNSDGSNNNNVGITEESLQNEYNHMVTNVSKNGGFWIGRYETSHMINDYSKDDSNIVKIVRGETEGINKLNWYRMYKQQKSYSTLALTENSNVSSSMIWGSQWDQIMIWMKNEKIKLMINTI